jgi:signal transduction histidine kinase
VTLQAEVGRVELDVADNGRGFDPHNMPDQSGLGLVSLRERVQSLGGQWSIDSAPGEGTRVRVSIPA